MTLFSIVCLHLEEHIGVEFRAERSKNGIFARLQICFIFDSSEAFSFTLNLYLLELQGNAVLCNNNKWTRCCNNVS